MNDSPLTLLCGSCGATRAGDATCPHCGSSLAAGLRDDAVITLPAGAMACSCCGTTRQPLQFRGWIRLSSAIWWTREERRGAYVCSDCVSRQTAAALLHSALLGWLAIPSWFLYGWRALGANLRAIFAAPSDPQAWGAQRASDFANGLPHVDTWQAAEFLDRYGDVAILASPLGPLDEMQRRTVLGASGLYERVGVAPVASDDEVHLAYRERSKALHPDVRPDAAEEMIRLNQAWEILGNAAMRDAYDWLREQRQPV